MRNSFIAVLAVTAILSTTAANAVPVTWHLTGEVTSGNRGDFLFPFVAQDGDPIAFDFTFDTQTACSLCDSQSRVYDQALTAFRLTVGDSVFDMPLSTNSIALRNDLASPGGAFFIDALTFDFAGEDAAGLFFYGDLVFQNERPTPPVPGLDDTELATLTPPDPGMFSADPSLTFFNISASSRDGGYDSFGGRFLTSSAVSVPEPGAPGLLIPGLLAAWFLRRRARTTSVAASRRRSRA